jgi:hypothetical protein
MDDTERQYRALLAVVLRAIHDAHHGNGSQQHEALIFLRSSALDSACSWLEIPTGQLRRLRAGLDGR